MNATKIAIGDFFPVMGDGGLVDGIVDRIRGQLPLNDTWKTAARSSRKETYYNRHAKRQ
jgi:hypothetical protein